MAVSYTHLDVYKRQVRDVVELYGGHIQISHEDGIFRVTIWIGHLSGAAA